ncbi:MAG: ATPase [Mycobacterium sp.]|jgi:hypothetical protein|nr:ATPase [Mycobacterium sp.]
MGRLIFAAVLAIWGFAVAVPAHAAPDNCPPNCDRIPDSAWIDPTAVPLHSVYHWPGLAGMAVTAVAPRFRFEELCATPKLPGDARDYVVASKAAVPAGDGRWQLQVQVMHWRGETWRGGQAAQTTLQIAVAALRACQLTALQASPSITTDEPGRMAAVISGSGLGQPVLHQYLVAHPQSSSVAELALWAPSPPKVGYPVIPDAQVLDALTAPLCVAYIDSCR